MNIYDIEKRRSVKNITVGGFCKYLLENVPTDAVFHLGGMSHFYLHIDIGNIVNIDFLLGSFFLSVIIERFEKSIPVT